jgi:hypothetical protein
MKFFTKYPKFTVSFIDYLVLEVLKKHLLILVNKFLYLNIFSLAKKATNQFVVLFFYFITRKIRTA